jgi:arginase
MQRQVELIGAAWGLGGPEPGCAEAPAVLAPLLVRELERCGVPLQAGPMLSASRTERRRQLAVSKLCGLLASAVADCLAHGRLPCVLGGDHSCAGGTWTGAARAVQGPLGLVWVDAHMDAHTPRTSHTGRLHGMPLAWLLGQDDDPLYGLGTGVIEPHHVALVGVRSFEPEERDRLERLGVRVVYMDEIGRRGIEPVLEEAHRIASRGTAAFGISVDLDVVTPDEAPGVGTPVPGGLTGAELTRGLAAIGGRPGLAAVELVEYSPRLDPTGQSARVAINILSAALCGARQQAQVVS